MREFKLRRKLLNSLPIVTERLVLRYIRPEDASDMYEYASVESVTYYLLWSPHINIEATKGYIEMLQKRYTRGLYGDWAVELRETGKMIGTCGYAFINSYAKCCEIGYVLSPYYRNKGYMTEAVQAILSLTFDHLSFNEATLRIMEDNLPSRRLAERVGFKLDRIVENELEVKGKYVTIAHYTMKAEDYKKIKAVAD